MGAALVASVDAADDLSLVGVWHRDDDLSALLADADVLIDFSLAEATATVLDAVEKTQVPLVCGVSAISDQEIARMQALAEVSPVVYDRNMSVGIAVLHELTARAAAGLGADFEPSIYETHHVHKQDAPSGTAIALGETLAEAREIDVNGIHFEAERIGEVPGDHQVIFASDTESLVLEHSVNTRQVFVDGALRAARWIVGRPAGLYGMREVLFSR